MKIGLLGTGMVGNAIATKLVDLGHEVMMGSRDANSEGLQQWLDSVGGRGKGGTFADAAAFGDLLFNCTKGMVSLEALNLAGKDAIGNKILVDVANPLDFSQGMPPTLSVCNTDSLGEQIQRAFPDARVVKTLNTCNCNVMVDPARVPGEHDIFISGNDDTAKAEVKTLLQSFGWKRIHDLGDITTARSTEQLMPIWLRLWGTIGHADFNYHIVVKQ